MQLNLKDHLVLLGTLVTLILANLGLSSWVFESNISPLSERVAKLEAHVERNTEEVKKFNDAISQQLSNLNSEIRDAIGESIEIQVAELLDQGSSAVGPQGQQASLPGDPIFEFLEKAGLGTDLVNLKFSAVDGDADTGWPSEYIDEFGNDVKIIEGKGQPQYEILIPSMTENNSIIAAQLVNLAKEIGINYTVGVSFK